MNDLWPSPKIPSAVLRPEIIKALTQNPNNQLILTLKENNVYDWKPITPIHLCHCDGDDIVSYQNSVKTYNSFINHGSINIQLINPLQGGNHATCALPNLIDAYMWFNLLKQ